jgi:hypothetical protein
MEIRPRIEISGPDKSMGHTISNEKEINSEKRNNLDIFVLAECHSFWDFGGRFLRATL